MRATTQAKPKLPTLGLEFEPMLNDFRDSKERQRAAEEAGRMAKRSADTIQAAIKKALEEVQPGAKAATCGALLVAFATWQKGSEASLELADGTKIPLADVTTIRLGSGKSIPGSAILKLHGSRSGSERMTVEGV